MLWLSVLHNFIQLSMNPGSAQVWILLPAWWGSLIMFHAENNAKHLSSVNHSAKTIHHHLSSWNISWVVEINWLIKESPGLNTAWKVSNGVSLRIQSKCGKIRTRKNSVFGHFSHSEILNDFNLLSCYERGIYKWIYTNVNQILYFTSIGKNETGL